MASPQVVGSAHEEDDEVSTMATEGPQGQQRPASPAVSTGTDSLQSGSGGRHQQRRPGSPANAAALSASAATLAGLRVDPQRPTTRESLEEQGIHGTQADAILVRRHEEEVLVANFWLWIQCFSLTVCLLTPAMLGIMIWMIAEYAKYRGEECDVPLQMWCKVVAVIVIFNLTLNRPSRNGSVVVRLLCLWEPDPTVSRRPPMRVRAYNFAVTCFIFGWNLFGLYLVVYSGSPDATKPPCAAVAPGLFAAVKVYVAVNLTFTVFFYVNVAGFQRVLGVLLHRGLLRTSRAAPKGTLASRTEELGPSDEALKDQATCSICLEDHDSAASVLRIKACGHVFHRQCLQGWLNVNRNCPICRRDLVEPEEP